MWENANKEAVLKKTKDKEFLRCTYPIFIYLYLSLCHFMPVLCDLFMIMETLNSKLMGATWREAYKRRLKSPNQAGAVVLVKEQSGRGGVGQGGVEMFCSIMSPWRWSHEKNRPAVKDKKKGGWYKKEGEGCFPAGRDVCVWTNLPHTLTHTPYLSL